MLNQTPIERQAARDKVAQAIDRGVKVSDETLDDISLAESVVGDELDDVARSTDGKRDRREKGRSLAAVQKEKLTATVSKHLVQNVEAHLPPIESKMAIDILTQSVTLDEALDALKGMEETVYFDRDRVRKFINRNYKITLKDASAAGLTGDQQILVRGA